MGVFGVSGQRRTKTSPKGLASVFERQGGTRVVNVPCWARFGVQEVGGDIGHVKHARNGRVCRVWPEKHLNEPKRARLGVRDAGHERR